MRIEHLEEFVTLSRFLNYTTAASMLNMSQSTLSKHISSLEKEIQTTLFMRAGNKVSLTNAGQRILPFAFEIIDSRDRMLKEAKRVSRSSSSTLVVGGQTGIKTVLDTVETIQSDLSSKYGNDFLRILDEDIDTTGQLNMSQNGSPDIAFIIADDNDAVEKNTELKQLCKLPVSCVLAPTHPLAHQNQLTIDDLSRQTLIKLEGGYTSNAWRFIERTFIELDINPNHKSVYFRQPVTMLQITKRLGNDALLLTDDFISYFSALIAPECVIVPVESELQIPISIAYSLNNGNKLIDEALSVIAESGSEKEIA